MISREAVRSVYNHSSLYPMTSQLPYFARVVPRGFFDGFPWLSEMIFFYWAEKMPHVQKLDIFFFFFFFILFLIVQIYRIWLRESSALKSSNSVFGDARWSTFLRWRKVRVVLTVQPRNTLWSHRNSAVKPLIHIAAFYIAFLLVCRACPQRDSNPCS